MGWCWVSIGRDIRGYYWTTNTQGFFFLLSLIVLLGVTDQKQELVFLIVPLSPTLEEPEWLFEESFTGRKINECEYKVFNNNSNVKLYLRTKLTARSVTGQLTVAIMYNHLPFLAIVLHKAKQCLKIIHCQYQQFQLIIHLSLTDMFWRKCKREEWNVPLSFVLINVLFCYQFGWSPFS